MACSCPGTGSFSNGERSRAGSWYERYTRRGRPVSVEKSVSNQTPEYLRETTLLSGEQATQVSILREVVDADFSEVEGAHDLSHLDRVARLTIQLAYEEGIDPYVVAVAAYVHDYHRVVERRSSAKATPMQARELVTAALSHSGVPGELWDTVLEAVDATGRFSFSDRHEKPAHHIAACLHDADMLDAMGAIGIARAFLYGGALGEPMWVSDAELQQTYTSGRTSSVIAHFYEKLIHLRNEVHTDSGRVIAAERHRVLVDFLRQFHREYGDLNPASVERSG